MSATGRIVALLEAHLAEQPNMSGRELIDRVVAHESDMQIVRAAKAESCARCGRPIAILYRDRWRHLDDDGSFSNHGCRAASFTDAEGWDESLDRRWKAKPVRRRP